MPKGRVKGSTFRLKVPNLLGKTLGFWEVLKYVGNWRNEQERKNNYWLCKCIHCGLEMERTTGQLMKFPGCRCGLIEKDASFHRAVRTYRRQARIRDLTFEITLEEFKKLVVLPCYYCGKGPELNSYSADSKIRIPMNGIDRRDSSLGYTLDNCLPACGVCNKAKLDYTEEEFIIWTNRVGSFQQKKLLRSVNQTPAEGRPGISIPEDELEEDSE